MRDDEADELKDVDWLVWNLEVRDPAGLAAPGIGERTKQAVTELSGALGCVFDSCCDDDAVDDVPYYAWRVRVPRAEHQQRVAPGYPGVVVRIWDHLRSQLPAPLDDWSIHVDRGLSWNLYVARAVHEDYSDLLGPVEVELLGLRREGAQEIEPIVQQWAINDTGGVAATYVMMLAKQDEHNGVSPWLVLTIGLAAEPAFWSSQLGQRMQHFGHKRGHPVLLLPRPHAATWSASLTTSGFAPEGGAIRGPVAVGARHQWTSPQGEALARQLGRDLKALFPRLALPHAGA